MKINIYAVCLILLLSSHGFVFAQQATTKPITKILFGSCVHQDKPQPIWAPINQQKPDLFMLLGDNIYGDTEDMQVLAEKYQKQANVPGFKQLRETTPVVGIWDDHDFGVNDGGAEYPQKQASKQLMLDYFKEPDNSQRRSREDGAYTAYIYGPLGQQVQVILLDLRWNRSALHAVSKTQYEKIKSPNNLGPYEPDPSGKGMMLGETQWQWLEEQLKQPADLRILVSSIQFISEFTGWESWANFPHERERMLALLDELNIKNLFAISGDTHWGELSVDKTEKGQSIWELTSSGLTESWHQISPNEHRQGQAFIDANFGQIDIQWPNSNDAKDEIKVSLSLKDTQGNLLLQQHLSF
ncbi:alkaline phosphatase D family protein [Aliiglaciecola lipolytica]|uniref:alkaline phosphatase D family protein n=1 Tax=Aliiglaciecola lipolytica TaxID=477689 RepID=UPI001C082804|nr:alkaline phosphatase D family protein [Aliiglaciecola lipolytica]MBU2877680.1 alkaline phosphatase family protein [Aliiglaciecola lipolytica]